MVIRPSLSVPLSEVGVVAPLGSSPARPSVLSVAPNREPMYSQTAEKSPCPCEVRASHPPAAQAGVETRVRVRRTAERRRGLLRVIANPFSGQRLPAGPPPPPPPRRGGGGDEGESQKDSGETARLASVHRDPLFRETAPAGPATGPRPVPTGQVCAAPLPTAAPP